MTTTIRGSYAAFANVGDKHTGQIVELDEMQQTDFATKQPLVWPSDGTPRMMDVITLHNPDLVSDGDDGCRRVFVKGARLTKAIKDAVSEARVTRLEIGGYLTVTFTGTERGNTPIPAKAYRAEYVPPG